MSSGGSHSWGSGLAPSLALLLPGHGHGFGLLWWPLTGPTHPTSPRVLVGTQGGKEARMEHRGSPVPLLETLNLSNLPQTSVYLSLGWACDSPFSSWVLARTGDVGE